jgi:phosphoglycerate kinase
MTLPTLNEMPDLAGVRLLLRDDLNVPIEKGAVADPFRIEAALPSIEFLLARGARVVIASHMSDATGSLKPVYEYLKKKIPVSFVNDVVGPAAHHAAHSLKNSEALILENLRWQKGEEANDEHFARGLASLADLYVNDAFPVSHRAHASVVGVPKLMPSYAGLQFMREYEGIAPALHPPSPSLAVIGGAKFITKEPLIKTLLKKYDRIFVGGALANDFLAAKGYEVGKSVVSRLPEVATLLKDSKLMIPAEVVTDGPNGQATKPASEVAPTEFVYDVGPGSIKNLAPLIEKARFVLWNGPLGYFEGGYTAATEEVARLIAAAAGQSVVGGGDTLSAIHNLKLGDKFTFVSTAGGAMLQFISDGTLPGIEALKASSAGSI